MPWTFNPDDDWQYIVIKEKVTVIPYDSATDTYGEPISNVDAYSYDRTGEEQVDGASETAIRAEIYREECGWVLRACQLNGVTITDRCVIEQTDGTRWVLFGEIKLATKKSRYVTVAYKTATTEAGV